MNAIRIKLSCVCPLTSSLQTLVDDSDPRIIYSDGWIEGGFFGRECQNTTHGFGGPNATATLNFSGVGVQVFGTISSGVAPPSDGSPSSMYQVDDLPPSSFVYNETIQPYFRLQLYASPLLNAGNHTLLITSIGSNQSRGTSLDYILYFPSTNELTSVSSASIAPEACISDPSTNITHSSSPNVGVITSGVLGGVLGIFLAAFFASIILRWKRKYTSRTNITPYEFGYNNDSGSSVSSTNILFSLREHRVEDIATAIHPGASSPQEAPAVGRKYWSPPSYRP
ncbi:hypothetical protein BDP27DRAFT_1448331 [Rhodocollybia butyracea]|uniref:Uncharacterized protein n=1 Tax=Rhodocollybia butyracea TaxID=206335 RepID=A0A9P5PUR3_9AGAR|nr:hypothetical protein BDP27DRAFT_1448331 [Rhodocollybia butyracea]